MTKCLAALVLALALTGCAGARTAALRLSPAKAAHRAEPATPWARQWVDTHGIEVAVPARWRLNQGQCGTPTANTVLWNEDGTTLCLIGLRRSISAVEFDGILQRSATWYHRHTSPVTIDGAEALRWDVSSRWVELIFPHRGITVRVFSPHRALVRQVVASVRIVNVNKNGCSIRPAPSYRLGSRPGSAQRFVPAGATGFVGCYYEGHWLDRSDRVGPEAARRLARALNKAPYGFSRPPRSSYLPSICGSTWHGSVVVARFEYPAGRPPVSVTAHLDGCARLGASNGEWTVQMTRGWVYRFVDDVSYAGSFPDLDTIR